MKKVLKKRLAILWKYVILNVYNANTISMQDVHEKQLKVLRN
ncbi:MAG: hypothetical protein HPY66_0775 [Firmicutes bacterium]|nr:hypothetical protein [Bacillota bacterium]